MHLKQRFPYLSFKTEENYIQILNPQKKHLSVDSMVTLHCDERHTLTFQNIPPVLHHAFFHGIDQEVGIAHSFHGLSNTSPFRIS